MAKETPYDPAVAEDFNNQVDALLGEAYKGGYQDSTSRADSRVPATTKKDVSNLVKIDFAPGDNPAGGGDYPPTPEQQIALGYPPQYSGVDYSTFFPSMGGIKQTLQSPLIPKADKIGALANLTAKPEFTAQVDEFLSGLRQQRQDRIKTVMETGAAELEAQGRIKTLASTQGELTAQAIQAEATRKQAIAADRANYMATAGVRTDLIDSQANQIAAQNVELMKGLREASYNISQKQSVSFLDDPATWLVNQFTISDDVRTYNNLARMMNTNVEALKSQDALVSATLNANDGKLAAMGTDEVRIASQLTLTEAAKKAAEADKAAAILRGTTEKELRAIDDHYALTIMTLENRAEQKDREIRQEARQAAQDKIANADRADRAAFRSEVEAEKKAKADEQRAKDARYASSAAILHIPGVQTEAEYKALPADLKKKIDVVFATGGTKLGDNPLEVVENTSLIGAAYASGSQSTKDAINLQYPPKQREMVSAMRGFANEELRRPMYKTGKPDQVAAEINKVITQKFEGMRDSPEGPGEIINGVATNYYRVPRLEELAKLQSNQGNLAAQTVKELSAATPQATDVTTPMLLTGLATKIYKKEINISDAARDVVAMYTKAVVSNKEDSMRFVKYGLPDQNTYPVVVNGKRVDMLNPSMVTQALLNMQASAKARESYKAYVESIGPRVN